MLELCSWIVFLFLMLHVLYTQSHEQETDHTAGEFNCSSDSATVKIQFFPKKLPYNDANRFCLRRKQNLLPHIMYHNVKGCILENLKNISYDRFWIGDFQQIMKIGTETNHLTSNRGQVESNVLCAQQDMMFKTFNLILQGYSSGQIDLDLLSSACETEHVFDVTMGSHVTLKYEATGIPAPYMTVKQVAPNLKYMRSINSETIMITRISLDTSGSENIFTCKDGRSNTSMSFSITVKIQRIVKVKKLTCEKTINTIYTNNNTDVAREDTTGYQGMAAPNDGDSLKIDTTTVSTTYIDSNPDRYHRNTLEPRSGTPGCDYSAATIPVALASASIVIFVCCVLCAIFVVVLHIQRERILKNTRITKTSSSLIYETI